MNVLISICARGGSKGIPGKNIRMLGDMPLIGYSIRIAQKLQAELGAQIALSTDDEEIKSVAEQFGLTTNYVRPKELSGDTAGKVDTIQDLITYYEGENNCRYDYILDLDVTSPLRTKEDITTAFAMLRSDKDALNVFSVNPASRNPYFNMVEKRESGYYGLVKTAPDGSVMSRQTAPPVYELNASFYWYKRGFFEKRYKSPINERSLIYVVGHICFDLDHPIDFDFMNFLMKAGKLNFDFS